VEFLTPATFIHELQHMISWNQHVIIRRGADEDVWLNEGLSLMAEELGARYYEAKYPAPAGRTNPSQLFPDSARGFIEPNLSYAYGSLALPRDSLVSVTSFKDFGELEERGAAWLFLRWLADHKGEQVLTKLEQTSLRGVANVAAQAGEPFAQLFGDFSVALWTDSLPGVERAAIPERYRFISRNFRSIFASMSASQPNRFPDSYPVNPINLDVGSTATTKMVPGAMDWFVLPTAGTSSPLTLRFSRPDLTQLARSAGAQISIFRLPDTP
jgi:hypothetical protein